LNLVGAEGASLTKTLATPLQVVSKDSLIAGKYRILEEIGHGGMGVVYKAEDIKLKRCVALRFLPSHLMDSPELKERFLIEAQAAAALSHPNICVIHEVGESDERPYIAMEFVEGETLRDKVKKETLKPEQTLDCAVQIEAGLWTTPTDLAKFAIAARLMAAGKSKTVLSPEIARLMVTPQIKVGRADNMALWFFLEDHGESEYFEHGGADAGFVCQLVANKDSGYGAAIMTNSDNRPDLVISEILRSIAVEYDWKDYVSSVVEPVTLGAQQLEPCVGRYLLS
jgi:hypothetical protein